MLYFFSNQYYVLSMNCAAVWQYSSNWNNKIVHNSIEHFFCNPSDFCSGDVLSCLWIVFTNSVFQVSPQRVVRRVEISGIGDQGLSLWRELSLSHRKICLKYSSLLFKVVVWNEVVPHLSNRTFEYLRQSFPWDNSQCLFLNILINATGDILYRNETQNVNTQESKERRFEEKAREKGWAVLIFT